VYNSFSSYLYFEVFDIVAQKLTMYDYAMEARKEKEEEEGGMPGNHQANPIDELKFDSPQRSLPSPDLL